LKDVDNIFIWAAMPANSQIAYMAVRIFLLSKNGIFDKLMSSFLYSVHRNDSEINQSSIYHPLFIAVQKYRVRSKLAFS